MCWRCRRISNRGMMQGLLVILICPRCCPKLHNTTHGHPRRTVHNTTTGVTDQIESRTTTTTTRQIRRMGTVGDHPEAPPRAWDDVGGAGGPGGHCMPQPFFATPEEVVGYYKVCKPHTWVSGSGSGCGCGCVGGVGRRVRESLCRVCACVTRCMVWSTGRLVVGRGSIDRSIDPSIDRDRQTGSGRFQ